MSIYLNYNAITANAEAENLARLHYDAEGYLIRDEPLRNRVASLIRWAAELQLTIASRLDDSHAAPVAA
jgi:hypothetical protein